MWVELGARAEDLIMARRVTLRGLSIISVHGSSQYKLSNLWTVVLDFHVIIIKGYVNKVYRLVIYFVCNGGRVRKESLHLHIPM
jgi:hypothetical protein